MKNIKSCTALFYAAAFVLLAVFPVYASYLPAELGVWRLVSEHAADLAAPGELGKWTGASYVRSGPPGRIDVQLTEGPGPGALFVPDGVVSSDAGPIGFPSAYETLTVAGRRAVMEWDELTGQSLAVDMGAYNNGPRTATFEARGILKDELLAFAESMVKVLQN